MILRSYILLCSVVVLAVLSDFTVSSRRRLHVKYLKKMCEKCPPGYYLSEWCSPPSSSVSHCLPCPLNTFRSHWNFYNSCKEFTPCNEIQHPGNATRDNWCKKDNRKDTNRREELISGRTLTMTSSNLKLPRVSDTTTLFSTVKANIKRKTTTDWCGNCITPETASVKGYSYAGLLLLIAIIQFIVILLMSTVIVLRRYVQKYGHNWKPSSRPVQLKSSQPSKADLWFIDENRSFPLDQKQKNCEVSQEKSISFSYTEGGNVERRVMTGNEEIHQRNRTQFLLNRQHIHSFRGDTADTLTPNLETEIVRGDDATKITVLKRSRSTIQLREISKTKIPFKGHTIHRSPDKRKSKGLLTGFEKKNVMNDFQIVPFVHNLSVKQQSFTEVEISVRNRHKPKILKPPSVQMAIHGTQTDMFKAEVQRNDQVLTTDIPGFEVCHSCLCDIPTALSESHEKSKVNNYNLYVNDLNLPEELSDDHQISWSSRELDPRYQSKLFDISGGLWLLPNSDVQLTVPKGAVPPHQHYAIGRQVITDLVKFCKYLREDERFIAPIAEFECKQQFAKHVRIDIPHCLMNWDNVHIQWGDSSKGIPFTDAPHLPKENNATPDVYFSVGAKFISIYTTHFTQFLCSEYHYVPPLLTGSHEVQLGALLLGKESVSDEQELHMKLFIIDALYKITDMKQHLFAQYKQFSLLCNDELKNMPGTISSETDLTVTLSPKGDWALQTKANGQPVQNLQQSVKIQDILHCQQTKYLPVTAAEFVLVLPSERRAPCFKGDLEISVVENKDFKKKTGLWSRLTRQSTKGTSNTEEQVYHNTVWVSHQFDPIFTKPHQHLLHSDEDVFEYIATKLPKNCVKPLLRRLQLQESDWEQIQTRHTDDLPEQKMQLLLLYREKMGKDFSMARVLSCLNDIGQKGLSQSIRDNWRDCEEE